MQTLTLPPYAQEHVKTQRQKIGALQAQLQAFVDGVVCGMGVDMQAKIDVDLETFTVKIYDGEGGAAALPELDLSQVDFTKAEICEQK